MRIAIALFEDAEELDWAGPWEVLGFWSTHWPGDDVEVVTVATGLVQVLLASGGPVLRQGEALIAERSGVSGWRNLSDREAIVFWVLHDDPATVAAGG